MLPDIRRDGFRETGVEFAITIIDDRQFIEGIETPVIQPGPAQLAGSLADGARAKSRPGAVGRRRVKRKYP